MSGEERHFKARVPGPPKPKPVDIVLTSHFGQKSARPLTERGRVFLAERYIHPASYTDQPIEMQPGRYWETFKIALRERGLRAQFDGSENHREVE